MPSSQAVSNRSDATVGHLYDLGSRGRDQPFELTVTPQRGVPVGRHVGEYLGDPLLAAVLIVEESSEIPSTLLSITLRATWDEIADAVLAEMVSIDWDGMIGIDRRSHIAIGATATEIGR